MVKGDVRNNRKGVGGSMTKERKSTESGLPTGTKLALIVNGLQKKQKNRSQSI
jgi:hypothetical protein